MVSPTGSSDGKLAGASGSASLPGLRLQAATADTIQFLAANAGKVIQARVVEVTTALASPSKSKATSDATATGKAPGREAARAPGSAENRGAGNRATAATGAAEAKQGRSNYRVQLAVGDRNILVLSALAPRVGNFLTLNVNNSQQLQVVAASALPPDAAQASAARAATQSSSANNTATVANPATAAASNARSTTGNSATIPASPGQALATKPATAGPGTAGTASSTSANVNLANPGGAAAVAPPGKPLTASASGEPIAKALRDVLPRQTARSELPAALTALLNRPANTTANTNASPATTAGAAAPPAAAVTGPSQAVVDTQLAAARTQLLAAIPRLNELVTVEGVKRAIQDSGLFYERKLSQAATAINVRNSGRDNAPAANVHLQGDALARLEVASASRHDYKHALLQLLAALQRAGLNKSGAGGTDSERLPFVAGSETLNALEATLKSSQPTQSNQPQGAARDAASDPIMQLLRLALGASARIQSQQLFAANAQQLAQADPALGQSLTFELPLWLDQKLAFIDMRVEREGQHAGKEQRDTSWHLRMRFDLEELGELTALATVHGKRMAAVLWASDEALAARIESELPEVGDRLDGLGLQVQNLQCCTGAPPGQAEGGAINLLQSRLLDTRS